MQAHGILRYAPRGPGLTAAVLYLIVGEHVYGWYTGAVGQSFAAAFFALEHFYSRHPTRFLRSVEDDLYGPWVEHPSPEVIEARNPVPDTVAHELARLQSAFVDEWLFFADAPEARRDIEAYERLGLPVRDVNIQSRQFERFDRSQPIWRFTLPGTDLNLIEYLARCWTLDDACETVPVI
jgi:hypothetical protein